MLPDSPQVLKPTEHPLIMGILNVTPDSFSDGGLYLEPELAIRKGQALFADGADIVDVGGESTRPGSQEVEVEVEISRVVPVIKELSESGRVSIDTKKPEVAYQAVLAGASIINDVSASLWQVAAELEVGWIAMHMQGTPLDMQDEPSYNDVVTEVLDSLVKKAELARSSGVKEVWIDPGFGFGKSLQHNLALLANIEQFVASGWPVAIGISRKSMLGQLLGKSDGIKGLTHENDRLEGSLLSATYAMLKGVNLVRVHDVIETVQARSVVIGDA